MRRRSKRLCWGNVYWGYKWTVFYIICPLWCKILALVFPLKLRQEQLSHWTLISECALELQQPPAWVTITFGTLGLASQELSLTSAKLAAAALVLSGFEIFNIFHFHLLLFLESDGQLNSGAAGPDHPATRRSHVLHMMCKDQSFVAGLYPVAPEWWTTFLKWSRIWRRCRSSWTGWRDWIWSTGPHLLPRSWLYTRTEKDMKEEENSTVPNRQVCPSLFYFTLNGGIDWLHYHFYR